MSASIEGNRIVVPIEIQLKAQQEINDVLKRIDDADKKWTKLKQSGIGALAGVGAAGAIGGAKGSQFLAKQGILQAGAGGAEEEAVEQAINDSILDTLEDEVKPGGKFSVTNLLKASGLDTPSAKTFMNMAKNPTGFFQNFFLRVLPIFGAIYTAKEVGEFLFKELTARGRPFDLTFRRIVAEENAKSRQRELRQQIRVGESQMIFVSEAGTPHPLEIVNTLEWVRNREIFEMDNYRIRTGYNF